jgi:hypothetical protein
MRLSDYFLPILRDDPKEAEIVSHRLMLRAGTVRQSSAGIYSWLPLGHRVLRKIAQIVREEQDRSPPISGARVGVTTIMARRCSASPTGMTGTCFTAPPMRS